MLRKLQEIRNSDQATKLRWLITLSAIAAILVGSVWIVAVRTIIASINAPAPVESDSGGSLLSSIGNSFRNLKDRTGTAIGNVKNSLGKNEVQLTPQTAE